MKRMPLGLVLIFTIMMFSDVQAAENSRDRFLCRRSLSRNSQKVTGAELSNLILQWQKTEDPKLKAVIWMNVEAFAYGEILKCLRKYRIINENPENYLASVFISFDRALQKFQDDKNVTFLTYFSYWIRHAVNKQVRLDRQSLSGAATFAAKFNLEEKKARSALSAQGIENPTDEQMAATRGLTLAKYQEGRAYYKNNAYVKSLSAPLSDRGEDGDYDSFDAVLASEDLGPDELVLERDLLQKSQNLRLKIMNRLTGLTDLHLMILEKRIFANAEETLALNEIAQKFDLSRERIRQIESKLYIRIQRVLVDLYPDKQDQVRGWIKKVQ